MICSECIYYSAFKHTCSCGMKNAVHFRPIRAEIRVEAESPACNYFVDVDEVM